MRYLGSWRFLLLICGGFCLGLLVLIGGEAAAQECNEPSLEADAFLLGPVKTFRIERVEIPNWRLGNNKEGPRKLFYEASYNSSGYMTKEVLYGEDGSVGYENFFSYDTNGRLTEKSGRTSKTIFAYDQHGNRIEQFNYGGPSMALMTKFVYGYDTHGRLVNKTIYSGEDNSIYAQTAYTYNDKGMLIEKVERGPGDRMEKMTCSYDDKDRVIKVSRGLSRGSGEREFERFDRYSYNENFVERFSSDLGTKIQIICDSRGHRLEEAVYDKNGSLVAKSEYDQKGYVSRFFCAYPVCYAKNGLEVYSRDFDLIGNWIKETVSRKYDQMGEFQVSEIIYRIIAYYSESGPQSRQISPRKITDDYGRPINLPFAPRP